MKVLVTGGAGFIGSHVSQQLLCRGHEVAIIDDLNDSYSPHSKLENLSAVRATRSIAFHVCDIRDSEKVSRVMQDERPDAIVHLAARVGLRPSLADPQLYESVNIGGTLVLLEACRRFKVPRFIFGSTSSIYGATDRVPYREDDGANWPRSPYAATKVAGEKLCYTYSHLYGLTVACLRFFAVYGPRQRSDTAILRYTEMIDDGLSIPVFGDGTIQRDYTYVDDAVQAIMLALELDCRFEVLNVGSSQPIELMMLVHLIENLLGKKATVAWHPELPGEIPLAYADMSKAYRMLGYQPATPIAQGLRMFIQWFVGRKLTAAGA